MYCVAKIKKKGLSQNLRRKLKALNFLLFTAPRTGQIVDFTPAIQITPRWLPKTNHQMFAVGRIQFSWKQFNLNLKRSGEELFLKHPVYKLGSKLLLQRELSFCRSTSDFETRKKANNKHGGGVHSLEF